MNFLFPTILWGLLTVAVPVIIHLFNFRKFRKVYFTNVRFLEELKQQTRRQSKLRHLLVLISRMLAIAALVFAFAQPYIPQKASSSRPDAVNQVNIYIDNSFTMEALTSSGPLIEIAGNKAREIAAAYRSTDLFMLTTNDFESRQQRWVSREEFLRMVDELSPSPSVRTVSEVIGRQKDSYYSTPGQSRISYLISDFQTSMADLSQANPDSLMSVMLVPLEAVKAENLYIDSCWFASPVHQLNQGVNLVTRVVNDSETDFEKVPLKFAVNGKQKAIASFDIPAGTFRDISLFFTNYEEGMQYGTAEITDYPVIFDDRMFLAYEVAGSIPVLSVNGKGESIYLNSLFGKDSAFRFVNNAYKNIDYNRLQDYELVILNELDEISSGLAQELTVYLDNGGTLLVIPSASAKMDDLRDFLMTAGSDYFTGFENESTRVSELDLNNPVFAEVFEKSPGEDKELRNTDLPVVKGYYNISRQLQSGQMVIMSMLNGKPFLTRELAGNGQVYLLAVPLDDEYSNFARHALFVPALYRIALLSAATYPLYYVIGDNTKIELRNPLVSGDNILKIISLEDDFEFIPGQLNLNRKLSLQVYNQVKKAGHYRLVKGDETIKGLAFNYNRSESAMTFSSRADLADLLGRYNPGQFRILEDKGKSLSDAIKDMNQGTLLWKLFIILALIFLAFEIILLRFWRTGQ
jgi:hypothetical protein